MPPKAGPSIWQDTAFLGDLALALYEAAHRAGGLSPPVKAAVEDALRKQGHETSWEAIRCVDFLPCVGALRRGPLSACPCLVSSPRPPFSLAPSLVSSAHLSFASIVPSLLSLLPLRAATHTPPDIELSIEANMSRQTMRWGPEVHQDILITLFQHASLTANDWSKVMEDLRAKGYTFSESALRYALPRPHSSCASTLVFFFGSLFGQIRWVHPLPRFPEQPLSLSPSRGPPPYCTHL